MESVAWILDIVVILVVVGGFMTGASRGFVKEICKLAGTFFALAFAFFFCVQFEGLLESWFKMTSAISDGFVGMFSGNELLATDISAVGLKTALEAGGVPPFIGDALVATFGSSALPDGTTLAMLIGPMVGKWVSIVVSFVILFILTKIAVMILSAVLGAIVSVSVIFRLIDKLLGGVLGLFKSAVILFFIFSLLNLFGVDPNGAFMANTWFVGAIYGSDWFNSFFSYMYSLQWINDYLGSAITV